MDWCSTVLATLAPMVLPIGSITKVLALVLLPVTATPLTAGLISRMSVVQLLSISMFLLVVTLVITIVTLFVTGASIPVSPVPLVGALANFMTRLNLVAVVVAIIQMGGWASRK